MHHFQFIQKNVLGYEIMAALKFKREARLEMG